MDNDFIKLSYAKLLSYKNMSTTSNTASAFLSNQNRADKRKLFSNWLDLAHKSSHYEYFDLLVSIAEKERLYSDFSELAAKVFELSLAQMRDDALKKAWEILLLRSLGTENFAAVLSSSIAVLSDVGFLEVNKYKSQEFIKNTRIQEEITNYIEIYKALIRGSDAYLLGEKELSPPKVIPIVKKWYSYRKAQSLDRAEYEYYVQSLNGLERKFFIEHYAFLKKLDPLELLEENPIDEKSLKASAKLYKNFHKLSFTFVKRYSPHYQTATKSKDRLETICKVADIEKKDLIDARRPFYKKDPILEKLNLVSVFDFMYRHDYLAFDLPGLEKDIFLIAEQGLSILIPSTM